MATVVSQDVLDNRRAVKENPSQFRLAIVTDIYCENDRCSNTLIVFAKDANYMRWNCGGAQCL